jgi:hypothetical protein
VTCLATSSRAREGMLLAFLLLAGCGQREMVKPKPGVPLPPKPATAPRALTPAELLTEPQSIRPLRSDEILTKSKPREDDPFDQPPPK